jgi:hypothetical protein
VERTRQWRRQNQHRYLEINGRQVHIRKTPDPDGDTRKAPPPVVQNEWHRVMREGVPQDMRLGDLIAGYLASLPDGDNKTTSRRQLARFERFVGREAKVLLLKPIKLTGYLQKHPHWKPSSVRTFVNRLHAALNWGVRQGLIDRNPISSTPGYRREGRYERRKGVLSDENPSNIRRNAPGSTPPVSPRAAAPDPSQYPGGSPPAR